jgi:hypothetical protein
MYASSSGDVRGPFDATAVSSTVATLRRRLLARERELIGREWTLDSDRRILLSAADDVKRPLTQSSQVQDIIESYAPHVRD